MVAQWVDLALALKPWEAGCPAECLVGCPVVEVWEAEAAVEVAEVGLVDLGPATSRATVVVQATMLKSSSRLSSKSTSNNKLAAQLSTPATSHHFNKEAQPPGKECTTTSLSLTSPPVPKVVVPVWVMEEACRPEVAR